MFTCTSGEGTRAIKRFVFIGFDAADYRLIRPWAKNGTMPNFQRLIEMGAQALVRSPFAFYVGSTWPSFYTGRDTPGHGRYCYKQLVPGTYDVQAVQADSIDGLPFWNAPCARNRRLTVIDVPKSVRSQGFSGTQVVDWTTHDSEIRGLETSPEGLEGEITARYGENKEIDCNRFERSVSGYIRFRDHLLERLLIKERFITDRLAMNDWDAFVAIFADTHCAGHQVWHLHDQRHDRYDQVLTDATGDVLADVYRAVDATVGRLLARIPEDCVTMVFASHGIGPHWDGTHMMREVLVRLDRVSPQGQRLSRSRIKAEILRRGHEVWPERLRKYAPKPPSPRAFRKAFMIPNNESYLGLRVNLEGREPLGRIRPGAEYASYCAALMEALGELCVGPGGPPAFAEIALTADRVRGPHLDALPDIVARWTRARPFKTLYSPRIGEVRRDYTGPRTGDHYPDGLLLARGGGIAPGERAPCDLIDLAPTFAALLGGTLPGADGKPIPWLAC